MKQTSLESDYIAVLLEQITERTGETNIDAVTKALEGRLQELKAADSAERTLDWLREAVWPNLEAQRGANSVQRGARSAA